MYFKIYIVVILLLIGNFDSVATADHKRDTLELWTIKYFSKQITRSKLKPLTTYLGDQTGYNFFINTDSSFETITERCITGKPDIILANTSMIQVVAESCRYIPLAVSQMDISLMVHKERLKEGESIKKIGVIRFSHAYEIAKKEYLTNNPQIVVKQYASFLELIQADQQDKLDAIIMPGSLFVIAKRFGRNWEERLTFKEKGNAFFFASSYMEPELREKMSKLLLSNSNSIKQAWQQSIGLERFISPDEILNELSKKSP